MSPELDALVADGRYEEALVAAKRLSIECVKQNRRGDAASALAIEGEILCTLNHPGKARSFVKEAAEFATRSGDTAALGSALAIDALALLRLGEVMKAQETVDRALAALARAAPGRATATAQIVAAEIALAREDWAEAAAFADTSLSVAAVIQDGAVRARAMLVKGLCAERTEAFEEALELFGLAEAELLRSHHIETLWQVKSAMSNLCRLLSRDGAAETYRQAAIDLIGRIAASLSPDNRERFTKHPAVVMATRGEPGSASGVYKAPMQVARPKAPPTRRIDGTALDALRPIFEVLKRINSELDIRKLMSLILDTMIEYCGAQRGTIVAFEGDKLRIEISRNRGREDLKRFEMGISRTVLQMVREKGRKIVADDAQQDPDLKLVDSVHENHLLSVLCLPMKVKLRLIGAVYLDNSSVTGAFGAREQEIAEILTGQAAIAIDNALLHHKATHDHLTHLFNHSAFEKRLEAEVARCKRHGKPLGLLMLDLDNFKGINDTHGHDAGNELLRAVAKLLSNATRTVDTILRVQGRETSSPVVARYGGDEFEVILPEANHDGLKVVAERILEAMVASDFQYHGKPIKVAFSIGGACFPEDAPDHHELILRADEALYQAKRAGKSRFVAYAAAKA